MELPASLEVVAESIPHIVWLADASGFTDYFNELGTQYTGLPRDANYEWSWVALVHPDDAERARVGWEHATRTTTPFNLTYRIRRSDGEYRWHAFRALPVRDPDGQVLRWIGTADGLIDEEGTLEDEVLVERQAADLRAMLETVEPVSRRTPATRDERSSGSIHNGSTMTRLAPRELAVARLLASGHTNTEIAGLLGLSLRTVEASRARVRGSLGVRTRAELVRISEQLWLTEQRGR